MIHARAAAVKSISAAADGSLAGSVNAQPDPTNGTDPADVV